MIVPEKYKDANIDNVPPVVREAIRRLLKKERGLYLFGAVGTGKTYIVWAIVNRLLKDFPQFFPSSTIKIWNSLDLLDRIKTTFDNHQDEFVDELLDYKGILVIDDIGVERPTPYATEQFYRLINRRYERGFTTFFTSNLPPKDLEDHLGYRTVSRIIESCDVIELSGKDKRLEQ